MCYGHGPVRHGGDHYLFMCGLGLVRRTALSVAARKASSSFFIASSIRSGDVIGPGGPMIVSSALRVFSNSSQSAFRQACFGVFCEFVAAMSSVVRMGRWSAFGGLLPASTSQCMIESMSVCETKTLSGLDQCFVRECSRVGVFLGRASCRSRVAKRG
jgi:hypothetical protein